MANDFDRYRKAKELYGGRTDKNQNMVGWIVVGVLTLLCVGAWVFAVPGYQSLADSNTTSPNPPEENAVQDLRSKQVSSSKQAKYKNLPGLLLRERKPTELALIFLDVGQGDCVFIQTPSGKNMLLDTGEGDNPDYKYARKVNAANNLILPFFKRNKIEKLDYLITSHPHSDHIGAAEAVVSKMPIGEVWIAGKEHPTPSKERLLNAVKSRKATSDLKFRAPRKVGGDLYEGMSIDLGAGTKAWLLRTAPLDRDVNNASLTILIHYGNNSILLTGDTENHGERELIEKWGYQLDADILKAGHHGSKTSSTPEFIRFVKPKHTVFLVGHYNTFGHPTPEVMSRVKKVGSKIHRTDKDGTIYMFMDGKDIRVTKRRDVSAIE